jgi:hypothetical protein
VFLEEELIRGSKVAREINLEKKRVHAPTPMVQEPFFTLPVVAAPIVQDTVVTAPVVSYLMMTMNEHEEPVFQDPIEPSVAHEEEQPQPHMEQAPEAPKRSQRTRRSAILDDYEVYDTEEFQIEDDPSSFEEVKRSAHSKKWLEAMQDEIKSMSTNKVWDLETILKGAKTGCKWVYKTKHDFEGNIERFKARLVAKGFTQRESIDYNETFSPISCKDSLEL